MKQTYNVLRKINYHGTPISGGQVELDDAEAYMLLTAGAVELADPQPGEDDVE